jgi:ATP-dependent Clp protease ATP-binding subunit ClpB
VFDRLDRSHLQRIVDIQIDLLKKRLSGRNIELEVSHGAKSYLAQKGYDPIYGARPLKRLIQREIENELALRLLDGTFKDGDVIRVDEANAALTFERAEDLAA